MTSTKLWSLASVGVVVVATTVACGKDYPLCKAGEYRACVCSDGAAGYQRCAASEDEYEACVCGGPTPGADAGADASTGAAGYLEACTVDSDCQSGFCGSFPSRGDKCTLHCASDADCPAPSPGCNPKLMCRSP